MRFVSSGFAVVKIACLCFWSIAEGAVPAASQIIVDVSSEICLEPIYIIPFQSAGARFSAQYISELEKILTYDFTHDGSSYVVPQSSGRNTLAASIDKSLNRDAWRKEGVTNVIKVGVSGDLLSCQLHELRNNSIKSIEDMPLTGELSEDRKQIHLVANALHKGLYGVEGVATSKILYTLKHERGGKAFSDVWEADYDGANAKKLSKPETGYAMTPIPLPAMSKSRSGGYFFVSYKAGIPKIYMSTFKDGIEKPFLKLQGSQIMPAISRQRNQIAFISDVSGNPDLFLQAFDMEKGLQGKPRQVFAHFNATQGSPTFSPDGKSLAFVSNKDGTPRVYVMKIPGPEVKLKDVEVRLISRANRESSAPSWSPDGSKLAYCARNGSVRQIWIYDFDTKSEWQLTQGAGNKENPSWAHNSMHLVYNTSDRGASELYMIDIKNKREVMIRDGSGVGEKRFPAWY